MEGRDTGSGLSTPIVWGDQIRGHRSFEKAFANSRERTESQNQRPRPRPGEGGAGPGPGAPRAEAASIERPSSRNSTKMATDSLMMKNGPQCELSLDRDVEYPEDNGKRVWRARPNRGGGRGNRPARRTRFPSTALDRNSGAVWTQTAATLTPHEGHHHTRLRVRLSCYRRQAPLGIFRLSWHFLLLFR